MTVHFHRYEHGADIAALPLDALTDLEAIVIRIPYQKEKAIAAKHLRNFEIRNRAVLIHTGWDGNWGKKEYSRNQPFLTADAARYLSDCQIKLVGIDSSNIDDTTDKSRPAHSILLKANIPIVEHLCNLNLLPDDGFTFTATPPRFSKVTSFPVRALAKLS